MQDPVVSRMDSHSSAGEAHEFCREQARLILVSDEGEDEEGPEGAAVDTVCFPPPAQVAALVSAPTYPNAVKWSDENLLAVSSGHLAYVLNPASLAGPRCFVPVTASPGFDVGKVQGQEVLAPSIIGLSLVKDTRPCVRSLAWSPQGFASNGGCLLAVCTTDHRVKFYRSPYFEFQSEWVQVLDVSEIIYAQLAHNDFEGTGPRALALSLEDESLAPPAPTVTIKKRKLSAQANQRMKKQKPTKKGALDTANVESKAKALNSQQLESNNKELTFITEGCRVEVLRDNGGSRWWLGGTVLKVVDGKALVRYDSSSCDPREDWFARHVPLCHGEDALQSSAPSIRPQVPSLLSSDGEHDRILSGERVEVWRDYGWQEGVAVDTACGAMKVSLFGDTGVVCVDKEMLRRPPKWNSNECIWSQSDQDVGQKEGTSCKPTKDNIPGASSGKPISPNRVCEKKNVTAAEYAARSDELAHLVVAWSPQCATQSVRDGKVERLRHFSVFAVGGKSGRVFFFQVPKPLSYSVGKPLLLQGTEYLGNVAAHESWITALEWVVNVEDVGSSGVLLLASGSSDGSVKLWISDYQAVGDFCPAFRSPPFRLLKQVMDVDLVPTTTLAMVSPSQLGSKVLLAIGKGSGSLAVLECHTSGEHEPRAYEDCAHDQLVTGLTWTSDGRVLYTCGQDNSLRIWEFSRHRLWSLAFPTGSSLLQTDSSRIAEELPTSVLESFFGVALSPGNLALVVVRGVSADMVDQMYQARSQKGAVQLYWIGGLLMQQDVCTIGKPGKDLVLWESRIVAALHRTMQRESSLVLWDILAATALIPKLTTSVRPAVEPILSSWLSNQGSAASFGLVCQWSAENLKEYLPYASCRRLQMLNVFYRRLLLTGVKAEVLSGRSSTGEDLDTRDGGNAEEDKSLGDGCSSVQLWRNHLAEIEKELRLRLIFVILFAAASRRLGLEGDEQLTSSGNGSGSSHAQTSIMAAWAAAGDWKGFPELMQVAASLHKSGDVCASSEVCSLCKAPVPLESLEVAYCRRSETTGQGPNHKLQRCAVSLKVMQIPLPLLINDSVSPSCPFCGILMQRLLPEFLLAPSPV